MKRETEEKQKREKHKKVYVVDSFDDENTLLRKSFAAIRQGSSIATKTTNQQTKQNKQNKQKQQNKQNKTTNTLTKQTK